MLLAVFCGLFSKGFLDVLLFQNLAVRQFVLVVLLQQSECLGQGFRKGVIGVAAGQRFAQ